MASPRSTIEDVARAAGVSVATVSRALRNLPNVAAETRAHIIQVATDLGYVAHPAAASLASGRTRTIGLAAPFYGIWYTSRVTVGVLTVLADAGYDLEIFAVDTPEHRAEFVQRVRSGAVGIDGLLLVDFFGEDHMEELQGAGIDLVCLGQEVAELPSMSIDNIAAGRRAVDYLIGLGHARIGLLGAGSVERNGSPVLIDRKAGFEAALRDAGLPVDPTLQPRYPLTIQGGAIALEQLTQLDDPPTALFALSDETAMGAMGRARELGVDVPGEVSIIGFDGHDLSDSFGLTTMSQPVEELGARIATWMLDIVTGGDAAVARPTHVDVMVELVERSSCAPPRPETL
jgi:LacI family repressor for deo operon, udp, cdd, tsx, nupC, and nupG